ncbi:MAG TPA: hypothetical protein VMT30_01460 [Candidatus Saccharimonadia bacterium]|nr:hypothetical protein [Candidatus Saccharimonadia bacterium]
MTDMGPRRMDGFGGPPRPAGARPIATGAQPVTRPAAVRPARAQAPAQPVARPVRSVDPRTTAVQPSAQPVAQSRRGSWSVVLQFVIGLVVIVAVAGAIVWLYIKYYQQ